MGVNQRWGINPDRTKHLGPLFNQIDFETRNGNGYLIIGKSEFKLDKTQLKILNSELKHLDGNNFRGIELTKPEFGRLQETIKIAYQNIQKREKLGL